MKPIRVSTQLRSVAALVILVASAAVAATVLVSHWDRLVYEPQYQRIDVTGTSSRSIEQGTKIRSTEVWARKKRHRLLPGPAWKSQHTVRVERSHGPTRLPSFDLTLQARYSEPYKDVEKVYIDNEGAAYRDSPPWFTDEMIADLLEEWPR